MSRRSETTTPEGVHIIEHRYDGGFAEISFYRPAVIPGAREILTAVVSRQIKGGRWHCHTQTRTRAFSSRYKTKAIDFATAHTAQIIKGN